MADIIHHIPPSWTPFMRYPLLLSLPLLEEVTPLVLLKTPSPWPPLMKYPLLFSLPLQMEVTPLLLRMTSSWPPILTNQFSTDGLFGPTPSA